MCAAASALLVTLVALLGAVGVLPTNPPAATAASRPAATDQAALSDSTFPVVTPSGTPDPGTSGSQGRDDGTLPVSSGEGKRVVFDSGRQRVWLVDVDEAGGDLVRHTFPASGSLYDNLGPGTYTVYSRSRHAVGVDDSGTMEFFVRFTHGAHAPIGFHAIPVKDGRLVQSTAQLGTPQSHGCIRLSRPAARTLWRFAPVGTKVVVTD